MTCGFSAKKGQAAAKFRHVQLDKLRVIDLRASFSALSDNPLCLFGRHSGWKETVASKRTIFVFDLFTNAFAVSATLVLTVRDTSGLPLSPEWRERGLS
jgi:hypothetical protein